jgi:hypothetical protein
MSSLDRARAVADAVLYEGYLLYPYRSTSAKNQMRWQFGVLGPPGASSLGIGEEPDLAAQCLLAPGAGTGGSVLVYLRFLQLQARLVEHANGLDPVEGFTPVSVLASPGRTWLTWDEGVEQELELGPFELVPGHRTEQTIEVDGGEEVELLRDPEGRLLGRVVRRRQPLSAELSVTVDHASDGASGLELSVGVHNRAAGEFVDRDGAVARSLLGTHLILVAQGAPFVSVIDPPDWAARTVAGFQQRRSWPVLAGEPGSAGESDVVLASPIILYDYPEVAAESSGALFDSTEIDEILTLRVMTMTDDEKAAARATDPQAAAIIDRCDGLSPEELQRLHGVLRNPYADPGASSSLDPVFPIFATPSFDTPSFDTPTFGTPTLGTPTGDVPWWDPEADASVQPDTDAVLVQGVEVRRGSLVTLRPSRRADAQDLFLAGQQAKVTAVLGDVDGGWHVAVVLVDDPAADLHEWYGRYLYFGPEELEPLSKENQS